MFKAFRDRRPWTAIVVSLFIGPWLAMAFLNKGRWALIYLALLLALTLVAIELVPHTFLPGGASIKSSIQAANLILPLVGAVHAYFITRKWNGEQPLAWYSRFWYLIAIVPVSLIATLLGIRAFLYQPFNIPSASMSPAVNVGDALLVSKSAYRFSAPERGDAVVLWAAKYHSYFIKRVIGIPGDDVQIRKGRLFINEAEMPQRRIEDFSGSCDTGYGCSVTQLEEMLPGGRTVRILDGIADSPLDNTGKFEVPDGFYFVLGDNRDNSNDSRDPDFGFVSGDAIIGKAAYKYASGGHWVWRRIN